MDVQYGALLGGLGLFLFGMHLFEETIAHLGKGFLKQFLEQNTNTRLKSIFTGIFQTAIFQSSTIVTMMTLGFVGAGVIGLSNALGVVIGANIGTTLTPWLVMWFGFNLNIDQAALPMIGLGGLGVMIFSKNEKIVHAATFLIGFGLLFLGLSYMKESVDTIAQTVSLESYAHLSVRGYVLIGAVITAIMQTSTGATIITLTALSAQLITLDMALGMVIGANLGSAVTTTLMGLLSSTPTQTEKKKLATSHLIFNVSTTIVIALAYPFIRNALLRVVGPQGSEVTILALFHTVFNVVLAVLWTPLLGVLLQVLHRLYPPVASDLHLAIDHVNTHLPEEVIHAVQKDTQFLLQKVEQYNRYVLYLDHEAHYPQHAYDEYVTIKKIEDKLLKYLIMSHTSHFTKAQGLYIHALNDIIIQGITSSKYLKDIQHHIINLKDESIGSKIIADSLHFFQEMVKKTSVGIATYDPETSVESNINMLENVIALLQDSEDHFIETITLQSDQSDFDSINIAEIIKTNRYVFLSCEALLRSYIAFWKSSETHKSEGSLLGLNY